MLKYFSCLRPLNLGIVYVTQVLFYFIFFPVDFTCPVSDSNDFAYLALRPPMIYLFALVTVLIAAGGYLINDYFDFESDLANRKEHRLDSKTEYLLYYVLVVFLGFLLSLYIAMVIGKVLLATIYFIAVLAMYLYSAVWKRKVLIGNLVVALFSAFVVLILVYAERDYLFSNLNKWDSNLPEMIIYSAFAFLISMVREIIKDIEDMEGDRMAGYKTLPIVESTKVARSVAVFFGLVLLATLLYWGSKITLGSPYIVSGTMIGLLLMPLSYVLFGLLSEKYFKPTRLSKVCKFIMISGILFLLLSVNF